MLNRDTCKHADVILQLASVTHDGSSVNENVFAQHTVDTNDRTVAKMSLVPNLSTVAYDSPRLDGGGLVKERSKARHGQDDSG